jgi:hypothetical protein
MQTYSYYVVMIDYGKSLEALVDPEFTRREVVSRIKSSEYKNIVFIHHITMGNLPEDVTEELQAEALKEKFIEIGETLFAEQIAAERQAAAFDHARALRNEAR